MVNDMAANEETVSIDTVKKTLWDSLEALGENISGETLTALMKIIEGGGGGVIEMNCTISVDSETGKQTVTTDVTAAEMFDACAAGKKVFAACTTQVGEDQIIIPKTLAVDGQVIGDDEEAVYEFCFATVSQEEGLIGFLAADLSADDTVVFTQIS